MRLKHIALKDAETHVTDGGEKTAFLVTGQDTDGRVTVADSFMPEGASAPWHYHEVDDEIFYIISGSIEFGVNDDLIIANAGDLVMAGPNVHRKFKALTDSHVVVINTPAGPAEGFIRDISSLEGEPTAVDKQRFIEKYGIHIIDSAD
jgi:quercetin dioxygenase-like cupin family protein